MSSNETKSAIVVVTAIELVAVTVITFFCDADTGTIARLVMAIAASLVVLQGIVSLLFVLPSDNGEEAKAIKIVAVVAMISVGAASLSAILGNLNLSEPTSESTTGLTASSSTSSISEPDEILTESTRVESTTLPVPRSQAKDDAPSVPRTQSHPMDDISQLMQQAAKATQEKQLKNAVDSLMQALQLWDESPIPADLMRRAAIVNSVADTYRQAGELDIAQSFLNTQLDIFRSQYPTGKKELSLVLTQLGILVGSNGKFKDAIQFFSESLELMAETKLPVVDRASVLAKKAISEFRIGDKASGKATLLTARSLLLSDSNIDRQSDNMALIDNIATQYGVALPVTTVEKSR